MRALAPFFFAAASVLSLSTAPPAFGQAALSVPPPQCVTSGSGEKACGYHCVNAYGAVRCAQTPAGICAHGSDILACWDPPGLVTAVGNALATRGVRIARPTCVTSSGKTACGYHCVSGFDQVQCAETPWGTCRKGEGTLACWDPPAAVVASFRDGARIPEPTCSSSSGKLACGYQCAATDGKVECTQTPEGICRAEQNKVTCLDPPPESRGVVYDPASARSCIETGSSPRLCGHHCVATSTRLACAATERGVCLESKGELACR